MDLTMKALLCEEAEEAEEEEEEDDVEHTSLTPKSL